MGEALVGGLLGSGWPAGDLAVVEPVEPRRKELATRYDGLAVVDQPVAADGVVIAVKPGDVEAACRAAAVAGVQRALSIAAGVPLAKLEDWLGAGVPVVRAMPNTPALVGAGAAAIAAGKHAGDEELAVAEDILGSVGVVVLVRQSLLAAVTGASGYGTSVLLLA